MNREETGPTRRATLLALAAGLVPGSATAAPRPESPVVPSLREAGAAKGITVGAAFSGHADPRYRALLARQVGLITPEWCLKPGFLQPERRAPYRFGPADETYAFARAAGLQVHGHTLFWHGDPLKWVSGTADARPAYRDLLRATMSRYPQTVSWDVANEVVADPGRDWREQAGVKAPAAFVAELFSDAAMLAPGRLLCLNDYNLECGRDWCTDKRRKMLAVVDELLARRVPLGSIGIQSHLSSRYGLAIDETRVFIRALARRGLTVHLSEIDVDDAVFPDAIPERDAAVAKLYRDYLTAVLQEPAVKRVVFWGIADFDHWLVREQTDDARPAGQGRPALFDTMLRPKPAFWTVLECLRGASAR